MMNLINSNQDPPVDLYHLEGSVEGNNEIDSLTKEPSDTLLMGDEDISTTPERENDEFIKSSVDDLVPIPMESEVTDIHKKTKTRTKPSTGLERAWKTEAKGVRILMKCLQAREDLMEDIQAFLKKYAHIPPREKSMALLLVKERFLKVKQAFEEEQNQPEIIQELLLQLIHDL
ncbi:hypothetical protein Tco_0679211 [Tanacetum coccineum]|uniref:Uncharacterized protein n=1 Tax=Tanacetum coccineum TaxID=301880 RepID=A0ABQ4XIP2_9ASTR